MHLFGHCAGFAIPFFAAAASSEHNMSSPLKAAVFSDVDGTLVHYPEHLMQGRFQMDRSSQCSIADIKDTTNNSLCFIQNCSQLQSPKVM